MIVLQKKRHEGYMPSKLTNDEDVPGTGPELVSGNAAMYGASLTVIA